MTVRLVDAVRAQDVVAVHAAVASRRDDVNELLKQDVGQNIVETPLLVVAAELGDANIVRALCDAGARIDARTIVTRWSYGGGDERDEEEDALTIAASRDHVDVVELLCQRGARGKADALVAASNDGSWRSAKMLLDHGADPGTKTNRPLSAAVRNDHLDVVKLLWEYGADVNASVDVMRPIEVALRYARTEIALFLLTCGAQLPDEKQLRRIGGDGGRSQIEATLEAIKRAR